MRSFEVWAASRLPSHALPATLLAGGPVDYCQRCLWSSHESRCSDQHAVYPLFSFSDVELELSLGNIVLLFQRTVGHGIGVDRWF